MNNGELFCAETSPSLVLIDVQGRRNPVLAPDRAAGALKLADQLHELGGTGKHIIHGNAWMIEGKVESLLLYYRSHQGRPTKGEIARAARIIARSEIREQNSTLVNGETLYVTGNRAVVYPEVAVPGADHVVFLVSGKVWFNQNRVTASFPCGEDQQKLFLDDINTRLQEGEVSLPRA